MRKYRQFSMMVVLIGLFFVGSCFGGWGFEPNIGKYEQDPGTAALSKDYPKSMQETWDATLAAARDIKLQVSKQQFGPKESLLEGVESLLLWKFDVKVQLVSRGDKDTSVKVIYGPFTTYNVNDLQGAAKVFHSKIMQHLGMPTSQQLYIRPGI